MRSNLPVWFCLCLLLLTGCAPLLQRERSPQGQIAYIGGDGNVYITRPGSRGRIAVTTDATVAAEGNGRSYHRLAWSTDGRLAYAAVERTLNSTRSQVYVATPGRPGRIVGESATDFVIYLAWSPQCQTATTCHLAYLIESDEEIDLHLVELQDNVTTDQVLGAGQPFYFTWAPDGEQMLWHTGGARQFHPTAALTRYRLAGSQPEILPVAPGFFLAPAWSPSGESWLDVIESQENVTLLRRVQADTGVAEAITTNTFDIAFAWSPDGRQVAYAARRYGTDLFLGPIYLYDTVAKTHRRLTDENLHVQAFFWSPDGQRIGYINWLAVSNENWAQWRVYNLQNGEDHGFNAFVPTLSMRMVISSFNQFAQSHPLWSPDSRYLLYADRDRRLVERIWLIDTWVTDGSEPQLVAEGTIGVWSWR